MNSVIYIILLSVIQLVHGEPKPIINEDDHIVEATHSEYPFIVSIGKKGITKAKKTTTFTFRQGHFCGGALISTQHVLAAAHCVNGEKPETVRVVVGMDTFSDTASAVEHDVVSWKTYFTWDRKKDCDDDHDIAVIKLKTPVTHNSAKTIPIYPRYIDSDKIDLVSVGWGETKEYNTAPRLRKISLKIIPLRVCEKLLSKESGQLMHINFQHMCTRSPDQAYLSSGDSGGPVIYTENGVQYVVAVNEAYCKKSCSRINTHSRVSHYKDFINDMVQRL